MTFHDMRRFFGPWNAPADGTNARHRAFLRKALELHTQKGLQEDLIRTTKLRLAMGSGINANQFGKILTSFVRARPLSCIARSPLTCHSGTQ